MISLSDDELQIVMEAARPIPAQYRGGFLDDVARELSKYPELGPGLVARVVKAAQRQHLNPPSFRYGHGGVKWRS